MGVGAHPLSGSAAEGKEGLEGKRTDSGDLSVASGIAEEVRRDKPVRWSGWKSRTAKA
jgi:hypothetical protein